jgi:hypothetical protein
MKKKYAVKGHPHLTRTTERTYSHAVIIKYIEDGEDPATKKFFKVGFCGNLGLARKLQNQTINDHERRRQYSTFRYKIEVIICEVEELPGKN